MFACLGSSFVNLDRVLRVRARFEKEEGGRLIPIADVFYDTPGEDGPRTDSFRGPEARRLVGLLIDAQVTVNPEDADNFDYWSTP